jgi:RNA polymerase sigma-70 factor (ECF subfamily)
VELEAADIDAAAYGPASSASRDSGLEAVLSRLDLAPAIQTALDRIPEPFRSTLLIVDVEDQSYEAAAEILAVPIGTVRSRLFRGRRLMQEQLLDYARDAGFGVRPSVMPERTAA